VIAALLLAAVCTPLATYTPTPVVTWDQVPDANLAGYTVYYREPGGTYQRLVDLPCAWFDTSDPPDGGMDVRWCRGPELGVPLQRYCPSCVPLTAYEFFVKAYNLAGTQSVAMSNMIPVCFAPLCVSPGPCN